MISQNPFQRTFKSNIVFLDVAVQILTSEHFGDLFKLVIVIWALEEGIFLENLNYPKNTMPAIITPNDQISKE